jgi:hypothetical protein
VSPLARTAEERAAGAAIRPRQIGTDDPATVADFFGDPRGLRGAREARRREERATETAIAALSALPRSVEAPQALDGSSPDGSRSPLA